MNKETTSNVFTLRDLEQAKDDSDLMRSKSLLIVHAILNGKEIDQTVWEYLLNPSEHRQDILIDVLRRLPHEQLLEKKKILNVLIGRDYFNENKLREWTERFVSSRELSKYLLDGYIEKNKKVVEQVETK